MMARRLLVTFSRAYLAVQSGPATPALVCAWNDDMDPMTSDRVCQEVSMSDMCTMSKKSREVREYSMS